MFSLRLQVFLFNSIMIQSLHLNAHSVTFTKSHTLNLVLISFVLFASIVVNLLYSSSVTGTGTVHAPKNQVTLGVLRTIYQLSSVTNIFTRIYPGNTFLFVVTFFHHALIFVTGFEGTFTSVIISCKLKLSLL